MFRLLRYFSITSAVALLAAALALYQLYRHTALNELVHITQYQSSMLSRSLANAVWPQFGDIARLEHGVNPEDELSPLEIRVFHRTLTSLIEGLPVLKVKIYNLEGLTVYSSNVAEIGELRDEPIDIDSVVDGSEPVSHYFSSHVFEPKSSPGGHRHYVENYQLIRGDNGETEGVLELYTDITHRVDEIESVSSKLLTGLLLLFAVLYAGLNIAVRHANRILARQYRELEHSRTDIRAKNEQLEEEILRRGEIESALRAAKTEAEAANEAKSRFLANMSHELRTPLNAVIGFSEVIADEVLGRVSPSRYRDYAADIRRSGRYLLAMVSDVLDLTRIEAGAMPLNLEAVKVGELVRDVARTLEPDLAVSENDLKVVCPKSVGSMVSDGDKLRSVLSNLIGNAVKFTHKGRIEVEVSREDSQDGNWVVFRVSDDGIGIEAGNIDEMFHEFAQEDASVSRVHGGAGLGLAITRRFCEILGGGVKIDSTLGEGTAATVRLPDRTRELDAGTGDASRRLKSAV